MTYDIIANFGKVIVFFLLLFSLFKNQIIIVFYKYFIKRDNTKRYLVKVIWKSCMNYVLNLRVLIHRFTKGKKQRQERQKNCNKIERNKKNTGLSLV